MARDVDDTKSRSRRIPTRPSSLSSGPPLISPQSVSSSSPSPTPSGDDTPISTFHPISTLYSILSSSHDIHDVQGQMIMKILQQIQTWYSNPRLNMETGGYPGLSLDPTPLHVSPSWIRMKFHITPTLPASPLSTQQVLSCLQSLHPSSLFSSSTQSALLLQHILIIHLTCGVAHLTLHLLYQHMSRIKHHITYWRLHVKTWKYPWFSGEDGNEKLRQLLNYRKKWMIRAGRLHSWIFSLSTTRHAITTTPTPSMVMLCERLFRYIIGGKSPRVNSMIDSITCLEECVNGLMSLDEHLKEATIPYEIPSHFTRYWGFYAFGSVVSVITAQQLYAHQDEIQTWYDSAVTSSQTFWEEHVKTPVQNIIKHVFHTYYEQPKEITQAESAENQYEQSRTNLTDMLLSYGKHHPPEPTSQSLMERAQQGDMSIVMDTYTKQVEHPIRAVMFQDLTTGILIQVQKLKVDGESALVTLEQLLAQNAINFNLLATIPAGLLLWGCFRFTSYLARRVFRERDTHLIYADVRHSLHHIIMLYMKLERLMEHEPSPRRRMKRIPITRDPYDTLLSSTTTTNTDDAMDDISFIEGNIGLHMFILYRSIWSLYLATYSPWSRTGDESLLIMMHTLNHVMRNEMTIQQQYHMMEQLYLIHPPLLKIK